MNLCVVGVYGRGHMNLKQHYIQHTAYRAIILAGKLRNKKVCFLKKQQICHSNCGNLAQSLTTWRTPLSCDKVLIAERNFLFWNHSAGTGLGSDGWCVVVRCDTDPSFHYFMKEAWTTASRLLFTRTMTTGKLSCMSLGGEEKTREGIKYQIMKEARITASRTITIGKLSCASIIL